MAHGKKYTEARPSSSTTTRSTRRTRRPSSFGQTSTVNFDPTIEAHLRLGVDPRHADQMVRGTVVLPHGTGKVVRVVVFAQGEKAQEALRNGADEVGAEDLVKKIEAGWTEFDVALATPDTMGMVGKLGKILGRKGLMPNPKSGTITFDIERALKEVKGGRVEFKVDKGAIIHVAFGKGSFCTDELVANLAALDRRGQPGQAGRRQGPVPQDADDRQHDGTRDPGRHPGRARRCGGVGQSAPPRREPRPRHQTRRRPVADASRRVASTIEDDGTPKTACARGPRPPDGQAVGA